MPDESRVAAWAVLAELFLDTQIDENSQSRIAARLRALPFSREELAEILRSEVAPAFGSNLFAVAGEWSGWSEEQVLAQIRHAQRPRPARRLRNRTKASLAMRMITSDWERISRLI